MENLILENAVGIQLLMANEGLGTLNMIIAPRPIQSNVDIDRAGFRVITVESYANSFN